MKVLAARGKLVIVSDDDTGHADSSRIGVGVDKTQTCNKYSH